MPADAIIQRSGPVAVPMDYVVPSAGDIVPALVTALVDGTNAAASFVPTLELLAPNGGVIAYCPISQTIAAGASANVSWFPRVGETLISGARVKFFGAVIARSTNLAVANATATDDSFDTVIVDTAGMANLGTSPKILTSQQAGFYLVSFQVSYQAHADTLDRRAYIFLNGFRSTGTGSSIGTQIIPAVSGATIAMNIAVVTFLNVGDFVSAGFLQNSGVSLNALADTGTGAGFTTHQFAAALIGVD